jgi:SAM-dependent methyltransferase
MAAGWDADRYQRQFGFVSAMAGELLGLLDPRPGEAVLDLGCGTGELAAAIAATGARAAPATSTPSWRRSRLRFVAVAGGGAARPAKLHRQMTGDRNR